MKSVREYLKIYIKHQRSYLRDLERQVNKQARPRKSKTLMEIMNKESDSC